MSLQFDYGDAINAAKADWAAITDDVRRFDYFAMLLQQANQLEAGDYIELGTLAGISLKVIHRLMDPTRTLYSFDTFTGFDARDLEVERIYRPMFPYVAGDNAFAPTSIEAVRAYLDGPDNVKFVQGWFPASFRGYEDIKWRFAHIDMDLYAPTAAAMELLWPQLVDGGIMLLHDFGANGFAAQQAIMDFCYARGMGIHVLSDQHRSVLLRKGQL